MPNSVTKSAFRHINIFPVSHNEMSWLPKWSLKFTKINMTCINVCSTYSLQHVIMTFHYRSTEEHSYACYTVTVVITGPHHIYPIIGQKPDRRLEWIEDLASQTVLDSNKHHCGRQSNNKTLISGLFPLQEGQEEECGVFWGIHNIWVGGSRRGVTMGGRIRWTRETRECFGAVQQSVLRAFGNSGHVW